MIAGVSMVKKQSMPGKVGLSLRFCWLVSQS